jgi:phosphohistidine phosphatase
MELILWRHAEADNRVPDAERALTARGREQADKVAQWLNARLPPQVEILVSPALRAQQTAQALRRPFRTSSGVDVGESAAHLLDAADWPGREGRCVIVVGHQPTLGQVAALLLGAQDEPEWSLPTAGVVWVYNPNPGDEEEPAALRASLNPDQLADQPGE